MTLIMLIIAKNVMFTWSFNNDYKGSSNSFVINDFSLIIFFLLACSDNKHAVIAVMHSNSELVKDALSELSEVCTIIIYLLVTV